MNLSSPFLAAAVLAFLTSCAAPKAKNEIEKAKKNGAAPPELVGRVASIPPERRFVLIQSYGKWNVPANSILTTQGEDERVANLLATGEALGQYAAADIQSGNVAVGDGVYYRAPKQVAEATETAPITPISTTSTPAAPETGQTGNVQKNN